MKQRILIALGCLLAQLAVAQQQRQAPSLQDLQREMLDMQRRMFEQFERGGFGNNLFAFPEGRDSAFFFHFDTTFSGNGFSGSFRFGPFGGFEADSSGQRGGFGDLDRMFQQFFNFGDMMMPKLPDSEEDNTPSDSDGLLPEERLRKEEEAQKTGKSQDKTPQKPKPKIKTIRI
jgi:hypothetical protein